MIKDSIKNANNYYNISKNLETGFEWLKNNDLENMPDGNYLIDGEKLYANIQTYETKDDALFEAHRNYIDIQYMINGEEKIGVADYANCATVEPYNLSKDIEFLNCSRGEWFENLNEGEFLVLFPNDAHKPSLDLQKKMNVKKVVVKVLI